MAKPTQDYNDAEAERRATEGLRRALTTPYKPQKEMVGKGRKKGVQPEKKKPNGKKGKKKG